MLCSALVFASPQLPARRADLRHQKGAPAVRTALEKVGVSTDRLVLENGAGLSRNERISADSLNQLLRAVYVSPLFTEFELALPIVTLDGTLRRRFNGSTRAGNAHLKTGTLRDVSALAGYLDAADGRRIGFVMLVNHTHARHAQAALCAMSQDPPHIDSAALPVAWLAQDADGAAWGYEAEPNKQHNSWYENEAGRM
jgi:D-alanyl-D-alanine carboxypeptidase